MTAGPCLGDLVAALVDGELDHAGRERAQRHVAHCATCRAELEAQRRLKARMSALASEAPAAVDALTARLLRVAVEPRAPIAAAARRRAPRRAGRTSSGPSSTRRPALRRRALSGTAFVALGLTAAFALGGPGPERPTTPLDPGTDAFVTEFVSTPSDAVPTVPASLTNGSVGSGR